MIIRIEYNMTYLFYYNINSIDQSSRSVVVGICTTSTLYRDVLIGWDRWDDRTHSGSRPNTTGDYHIFHILVYDSTINIDHSNSCQ